MIRAGLIATLLISASLPVRAERLWLVVGASDPSPVGIAQQAKALSRFYSGGSVVQTSDCGESNNAFAWVLEATPTANEAQIRLSRLRARVKDAYVKPCDVQPGTLLAFAESAVDRSIADVPKAFTSWADGDRVSSAYPLADGRTLLVLRYFMKGDDSPLEGRHARIVLASSYTIPELLQDDCADAGGFAAHRGFVTFHCGDRFSDGHLLHAVSVFDKDGKRRAYIRSCRDPTWSGDAAVDCWTETVTADGRLELRRKQVGLDGIAPKVERLWLAIAAGDSSPAGIARQAKALSRLFPDGFVVQMSDCGGSETAFAWVAQVAPTAEEAGTVLSRLHDAGIKNAAIMACETASGTLLAWRMSAVDASIADVPDNSVNWSDRDRVSSAHPLPDGRTVLVVRYFDRDDDSPYEGATTRVFLASPGQDLLPLEKYCPDAGGFTAQNGRVALHCGHEVAIEFLLHRVDVFDRTGNRLATIAGCRDPVFYGDRIMACQSESITEDGRLELRTIRTVLPN